MKRGLGIRNYRSVGEFSPLSLFAGGVQGAWYDPSDSTTLFSDRAGTTPCAAPGAGALVPVGLMLDKSQNGVGTNGAKRVNLLTFSEQFDNAAWGKFNASAANTTDTTDPLGGTTADKLSETTANNAHLARQGNIVTAAVNYTFSCYLKAAERTWVLFNADTLSGTNGYAEVYVDLANGVFGNQAAANGYTIVSKSITSAGNGWWLVSLTYTATARSDAGASIFLATGNGTAVYTGVSGSGVYVWGADLRLASEAATLPTYQRITDTWYATMAGNHAIAANDTTARPELSARVNLLTYSEQFDNAVWTKTTGGSITATNSLAPDNTNTADTWTQTGTPGIAVIQSSNITVSANQSLVVSLSVKKVVGQYIRFYIQDPGGTNYVIATFDLDTPQATEQLAIGTGASISSAVISSQNNGYYRLTITGVIGNFTSVNVSVFVPSASTGGTRLANGSCLLWGADLRPANIGTTIPAYQRVADQYTYDTVGFPRYLAANGTSSAMSTPANVNLSGTDKATVFAGVRKLSDASQRVVAELSATIASNNGAFLLTAPNSAAANYNFSSKGTTQVDNTVTTFAAPLSNVLTGQADIAAPSNVIRVNGAATAVTSTQGTGNFGSYPLFIGARNNASLWFNGNIYSLIVAGTAVSAGNITATEQWVAGKTGITI